MMTSSSFLGELCKFCSLSYRFETFLFRFLFWGIQNMLKNQLHFKFKKLVSVILIMCSVRVSAKCGLK